MKTSGKSSKVRNKKEIFSESVPTEEEMREKGSEIYLQRIDRREHGTTENDGIKAEQFLLDPINDWS